MHSTGQLTLGSSALCTMTLPRTQITVKYAVKIDTSIYILTYFREVYNVHCTVYCTSVPTMHFFGIVYSKTIYLEYLEVLFIYIGTNVIDTSPPLILYRNIISLSVSLATYTPYTRTVQKYY